jgi:predicted acyltransferase
MSDVVPSGAGPGHERPSRLASLDAYRGAVMLLMIGEALRLLRRERGAPASALWAFLCHHQGACPGSAALHDLIQPSFSFLVGGAAFSVAARAAAGRPARA